MSDFMPTEAARERTIQAAKNRGHRIVYGHSKLLTLDIDSRWELWRARRHVGRFWKMIGAEFASVTRSKSGRWHVYIELGAEMNTAARIFWQAVLGSDPMREALNWTWYRGGGEGECFLIETPNVTYRPFRVRTR